MLLLLKLIDFFDDNNTRRLFQIRNRSRCPRSTAMLLLKIKQIFNLSTDFVSRKMYQKSSLNQIT